jgi:hypothetical protein
VRAQLGQAKGQIVGSTSPATEQNLRQAREAREDLIKAVLDVNTLITDVPAVYDKVGAGGLKPPALKPVRAVPAQ